MKHHNERTTPLRRLAAIGMVTIGAVPAAGALHDQAVHCRLTGDALSRSTRFRPAMAELKLASMKVASDFIAAAEAAAPPIRFLPYAPQGLVMAGSVLEDGTPAPAPPTAPSIGSFTVLRVVNHFQDDAGRPLTAVGLLAPGHAARDWARTGPSVPLLGPNQFSWDEALRHYGQALLADTPAERASHAEHMLVAVGCNLHLLQDQSSPAHTRNDMHPPHEVLLGTLTAALGSSLLEERGPAYIGVLSNPFLKGGSLSPERYASHREYFDNLVLQTSSSFFSDDTVLSSYPNPSASALLSDPTGICSLPALLGERNLRGIAPAYLATNRLARERWVPLPNNLTHFSSYTLAGSSCDTLGLDSVIHDNLALLVPTAVRYSAGLLDHFFRGRLTLAQEPGDVLRITNESFLPTGVAWNADFVGDPLAHGPAQVRLRVHMPDGTLRDVHVEPLAGALPKGQSIYVPNFGALLPPGSSGLVVGVLENAWIGPEAGAAGGYVTWAQCAEHCDPGMVARVATPLHDCDGDLATDFAIHRPFEGPTTAPDAGSLTVYSGQSCAELWSRQGSQPQQLYGARVVPIGDRNGDGFGDLIVQDSYDAPAQQYAMLGLSGRTGNPQFAFDMAQHESGPLAPLGHVDSDAVVDFAVLSAPISIRSGATGQLLRTIGVSTTDALSVAADLDGDGARDLLAERSIGPGSYQYTVYSSATTAVLATSFPTMQSYRGFASLADTNGDAVPDFVGVRSPDAALFSGLDGSIIDTFDGLADQAGPAGDFDGDGRADFVLRRLMNTPPVSPFWSIQVHSGFAPLLLLSLQEPHFISGIPVEFGDLNADGYSDLAYPYTETQAPQSTCLKFLRGSP